MTENDVAMQHLFEPYLPTPNLENIEMTDKYKKERQSFLTAAGQTFDNFVEQNGEPPAATAIVNAIPDGPNTTSWLTHSEIQDESPDLLKSVASDFTRSVEENKVEMYSGYDQIGDQVEKIGSGQSDQSER